MAQRNLLRDGFRAGMRAVMKEAGPHGVIARRAWGEERVLHVAACEPTDGNMTRVIAFEITSHSFGNFDPTDEDLRAIDWYVVSKSVRRHKGLEDW